MTKETIGTGQGETLLEVLFTPADFDALKNRDISSSTCVIFDILRASTSIVTALANGAAAVLPVGGIKEALDIHRKSPDFLLAGERDGLKITRELTGSVDFHLGNSPREFTPGAVNGKTIVMTTTNGTRALTACRGANRVLVSSFLNLQATAAALLAQAPRELLIVCSGTFEQAAYEDVLAAGALCDHLWHEYGSEQMSDSTLMASLLFSSAREGLGSALTKARNAKRLLARPDLAEDVRFCAQKDTINLVATLGKDGKITREALPRQH